MRWFSLPFSSIVFSIFDIERSRTLSLDPSLAYATLEIEYAMQSYLAPLRARVLLRGQPSFLTKGERITRSGKQNIQII